MMQGTLVYRFVRGKFLLSLGFGLSLGFVSVPVNAVPYLLTYTGSVHAADSLATGGGPDLITADSSFTFTALFDSSTPNVVAPLPNPGPGRGFVAYIPSQANFTIGGLEYALTGQGSGAGPTIAIFDKSNVFNPGRYGIGLIVNPLADGAGFVGDFLSATPDFSLAALGSTTFQDFAGIGFNAGIGCGPDPAPCTFQPIALARNGQSYALQFAGTLGAVDGSISYEGGTSSATLSAVPEPAAWVMMLLGFGILGVGFRRGHNVAQA